MIISSNRSPSLSDFQNLISLATRRLNDDAVKRSAYYLERNAQLLEDDVRDILDITAKGTKFEGTIKKISAQFFPDIVVGKYYGVEVKSSKDDKWITLGGSVNESTRIKGVERIFLTFGKLVNPIEFRSRPYENCLSDVVVTHYPRYKINMNLPVGETIFDKMETTYDDLRSVANPVGQIVDYYKSRLAYGESLWWTGKAAQDEQLEDETFMKIRLFNTLTEGEKRRIRCMGLSLFPNVFGSSNRKYQRFAVWLAANCGVVCTATRDIFSASGQGKITTEKVSFKNVPRIIMHVYEDYADIASNIETADEAVLCETWCVDKINTDRIGQWISQVANLCPLQNYNVRDILNAIFNRG